MLQCNVQGLAAAYLPRIFQIQDIRPGAGHGEVGIG
jgi:hypothetical protein